MEFLNLDRLEQTRLDRENITERANYLQHRRFLTEKDSKAESFKYERIQERGGSKSSCSHEPETNRNAATRLVPLLAAGTDRCDTSLYGLPVLCGYLFTYFLIKFKCTPS